MTTYQWNVSTGDWNNNTNWLPNSVPSSATDDNAENLIANSTIDVSDYESADNLTISAAGSLLNVEAGGFLSLTNLNVTNGNITIGGFLNASANISLSHGTLTMTAPGDVGFYLLSLDSTYTLTGSGKLGTKISTIYGTGTVDANGGTLAVSGTVDAGVMLGFGASGGDLLIEGNAESLAGIVVNTGDILSVSGILTVDATQTISHTGELLMAGGSVDLLDGITLSATGSKIVGYGDVQGTIDGPGKIIATGGLLEVKAANGGSAATFEIKNDSSTLQIDGAVSSGTVIHFDSSATSGSGTLFVNQPLNVNGFAGTLDNFVEGTTLELDTSGNPIYSATYASGEITFKDHAGHVLGQIASNQNPGPLSVVQLGGGLVDILSSAVPCFLRGTAILTPHGEMPVELLEAGDHVTTLSGERKTIRWIGTGRTLVTPLNRERCAPIVVRRGALAENVPHRDLYVTRGHSLFIEGYLIPAEELINHRSIAWVEGTQVAEYYHVELDEHDVLVAEGAAAESYREDENHAQFHNSETRPESYILAPCAEILHYGPELKRIWQALSDRAGVDAGMETTADPDLHLVVDGSRIDAVSSEGRVFRFQVGGSPADMRIVSRSTIPSALGFGQDQRKLGVAVRKIVLSKGGLSLEIGWDGCELTDGFNDPEPAEGHRWTQGDAGVPAQMLAHFEDGVTVEVHVGGISTYAQQRESLAA